MDLLSVVPRHVNCTTYRYHLSLTTSCIQLAYNTTVIQKRHLEHVRRQLGDAQAFEDNHYPTFYGGDFSNVS